MKGTVLSWTILTVALLALAALPTPSAAAPLIATPDEATAAFAAPEAQLDPNIVLEITSPRQGQRLRGPVEITGYAFDRRSQSGSGLNDRDVRIYLNDSNDEWNLFDFALAGRDSPEAASAHGPARDKVGFWDLWETCSFPEAPYKLIVWVSSTAFPGARQTKSIDVYVERCEQGAEVFRRNFADQPGGVHTLRVDSAGARSYSPDPIFADFAAGVDAQCPAAQLNCFYGIDFRELPGPGGSRTNTYYRYYVDPTDNTFALAYSPPGDDPLVFLVPWTETPAIRGGSAVNRIAVIAQGNWIRMFVNGRQVGEYRDRQERRAWGQIGWMIESRERDRPVEGRFGNFLVSTPGPAERLAPLFPSGEVPPQTTTAVQPAATANLTLSVGNPGEISRLLLRDDFRDPASGWPRESREPSARRVGYVDGEYRVAIEPSVGTGLVSRSERFGNFQAEIDARLTAPTDDAFLFLAFRGQENGDYYAFVIDPNDSTYWLARAAGSSVSSLIEWTTARAIRQGTARNRLGVRAAGAEIVLLVNGQEVGRAQDSGWREGTLAFGVGSLANGPAEGYFSNLVVTSVE